MKHPDLYIDFLVYFHGVRDYFECHEVLEIIWKRDERGFRKKHWSGLISVAVAMYHYRRDNFTGAGRSMKKAVNKLENEKNALADIAIDHEALMPLLKKQLVKIEEQQPYESLNLPITDPQLIQYCQRLSLEKGSVFGNPSDLSDTALINKHKMPNRHNVISKRESQKRETDDQS